MRTFPNLFFILQETTAAEKYKRNDICYVNSCLKMALLGRNMLQLNVTLMTLYNEGLNE
jgi:hypothetical protein